MIAPEDGEPVIHLENRRSGLFLHRPEDVALYREAAEWEHRVAMGQEDSTAFITELIDKMESQ
jgi:hypothetical protein